MMTISLNKLFSFFLAVAFTLPLTTVYAAPLFTYGQHEPNGLAAVNYIYGPNGTWKPLTNVTYYWNFYSQYATSNHPFNKTELIKQANGSQQTTARDANGYLLLDFNNNGEIDTNSGGSAFCEHNGKGVGGQTKTTPFTQFWFDDNWLARHMSNAYGRTPPNGLWSPSGFTRWRIMDGNTTQWTPYNSQYFDTLALDGLYHLARGDTNNAVAKWNQMLANSGATYDAANQQDRYPNLIENYHLSLFKILTEKLLLHGNLDSGKRAELVQHAVTQRSILMQHQEYEGGKLIAWRGSNDPVTLINTENASLGSMALGSGGKWTFEVGRAPMSNANNRYFLRPYNVLSAVTGLSSAGFMAYGPYRKFPIGSYQVDYLLRAPNPFGSMATLDVYDSNSGAILATRTVNASEFAKGIWNRFTLSFSTNNNYNSLEFRLYWHNTANMDAAYIQVR
jgi:hypothetical protein